MENDNQQQTFTFRDVFKYIIIAIIAIAAITALYYFFVVKGKQVQFKTPSVESITLITRKT